MGEVGEERGWKERKELRRGRRGRRVEKKDEYAEEVGKDRGWRRKRDLRRKIGRYWRIRDGRKERAGEEEEAEEE